jgi:hypothetical protein
MAIYRRLGDPTRQSTRIDKRTKKKPPKRLLIQM